MIFFFSSSDYVNNELKNQLEGIDGVASVSTKGIVTQKENVIISQTKIDALNAKINDALNDKFGDAEKKISDAKKESLKQLCLVLAP